MQQFFILFKIILPIIASALFCALVYTFKNYVFFGIQLTQEQAKSKTIRSVVRLYELSTAIAGFILTFVNLYFYFRADVVVFDLACVLTLFLFLILFIIFYFIAQRNVKTYKARIVRSSLSKDVQSSAQNPAPLPTDFSESCFCPSLWWYMLHVLLIAFGIVCLYALYYELAPYVSLWCDFKGISVFIAKKSVRVLSIPIILQILITLFCFRISAKIKYTPLDIKRIVTCAQLKKSRKLRAVWSVYVYALALITDLALYGYIYFMFLMPKLKAFAVIILISGFVLMLASTLILAFISSKTEHDDV